MKKPNQASKQEAKTTENSPQQKPSEFGDDLLISEPRVSDLKQLCAKLGVNKVALAEKAILNYLDFVEEFPHLAQTEPQFVHATALLTTTLSDELAHRLREVCKIYALDPNSVADSALRVYIEIAGRDEFALNSAKGDPGGIDPQQIVFTLSQASSPAMCMFAKIANRLMDQTFEGATGDLEAFRDLIKHHPALDREREALEMITTGANRLWASPSQARWREARQS